MAFGKKLRALVTGTVAQETREKTFETCHCSHTSYTINTTNCREDEHGLLLSCDLVAPLSPQPSCCLEELQYSLHSLARPWPPGLAAWQP